MASSTTTQSFVDQLRAEGLNRGYSPQEIEAALARAGYVQASDQGGGGGGLLRSAGLAARGTVQGLGNLVGLPFGMAGMAYQAATGNAPPQMLQPQGEAAATQLGLPQPANASERVGVAGAEGMAVAAPFGAAGAVPRVAGTLLGGGAGVAGQVAQEAGVGPLGQMAASMAVGFGAPVAAMSAAATIRAAMAGTAARRQAAEQARLLLQAGDPNAAVSLGQVTQGGLARTAQGGLRNVPGATEVFKESAERQAAQMGRRASRIADRLSTRGDPTAAGRALQRGIETGFIPRFRATQARLERAVWGLVPESTLQYPQRTVQLFADQGNLAAQARPFSDNLVTDQMKRWSDDLVGTLERSPDGIPLGALRAFRSRLGLMLDDAAIPNVDRADLHRLYGALSDDIGEAVARTGGAPATKAWTRAQNYWRAGRNRLDDVLQPLLDKKTPEIAFNAVMSGSRDGATVLRSTMRSLGGEQRRVVASTVVRRLGEAPAGLQGAEGGMFSPETFLTKWNKLSPEARAALFDGIDPMVTKNLNSLAKAIELRKKASGVLPQTSGTAPNTAFWAVLAGIPTTIAGLATGSTPLTMSGLAPSLTVGGANLTARMFTSPRMVEWMVKQTKVPFGALSQELAILAKDSQKWTDDPEAQEIASQVVDTLSNIDWNSILLASAVADASAQRSP